ncbi:MAG: (d)CMP kinase [Dehalococcoidia bacterium]|nr:(d)CMP kinase [Dehalococcoidia bacterium]
MRDDTDRLPRPIAIDGPAASGKSSVGEALAREFGYRFLDTGLMYRAFALAALRAGVKPDDPDACSALAAAAPLRVEATHATRVFLGDEDVTAELREPHVEDAVSGFSKVPAVREVMVARQRTIAADGLAVLAGRDIGTVVLPDAPLKLYLDADEHERAVRRQRQAGESTDERALGNITRRDEEDSKRTVAPLQAAPGAVVIDTTHMALEDVIARVFAEVRRFAAAPATPGDVVTTSGPQPRKPSRLRTARTRAAAAAKRRLAPVRSRMRLETVYRPFYWLCVHVLRAVLWVVGRWKAEGRENVPRTGALIVVSNHLNNADPPILASGVARRRIHFMAKVELFRMPFGIFPRLYGAFPVRRFESDLGAMLTAERILRRGGVIGMFPEGHRSRTGRMGPTHPGTAMIALRAGATVLPCSIVGTEQLRNPLVVLRKPKVEIRIGEPIPVPKVKRPTEQQVSELTTRITEAIAALLPPDYRPAYTGSDGPGPTSS